MEMMPPSVHIAKIVIFKTNRTTIDLVISDPFMSAETMAYKIGISPRVALLKFNVLKHKNRALENALTEKEQEKDTYVYLLFPID